MKVLLHPARVLLLAPAFFFACSALPEEEGAPKLYSVEEAMEIVAIENDVTRTLYTKAIVGEGQKQGMKFDENWEKDDVEAGPLPALFLRGVSTDIQKRNEVPLGLYLGSDFPVRKSNKLAGKQGDLFAEMRKDKKPKFFYDEANQLQTAMFPDFAVAKPCVECHNKHPETTKTDWAMGDLMGATTWTYPQDSLSFEDLQAVILAYRNGVATTYESFLAEVKSFKGQEQPEIGDQWPGKGYFLPSTEAFVDSVTLLASTKTLKGILKQ
jgi:adenylate cyclase